MKTIYINEIEFIIQSYLIDDFCYLVPRKLEVELSSIRINFCAYHANQPNNVFSSNQKTDKSWFDFIEKIDVEKIEKELCNIFHGS